MNFGLTCLQLLRHNRRYRVASRFAQSATNSLLLFFPDICVAKVTGRDWLQGGKEGSGDGRIAEDGEDVKDWCEKFANSGNS